jgi:hypothetical protein
LPAPTGTVGTPNVPCLIGYTWRKAFPGDWVCVSPATAAQAQADNAAAESLIQPGGGPYGPYTCRQGYVWRQVVPSDYTCVDYAVRTQAWYDNSQAANRVAFLRLCTQGYSQGLFQYIAIDGNAFNFGPVELQVRHTGTGTLIWSGQVTATSIAGLPGGSFYYDTPVLMVPAGEYYIAALDVSGRYSSQFPVPSACS